MTIKPYTYNVDPEMPLEDRVHHLAAYNHITVGQLISQDEFPSRIASLKLEAQFKEYIINRGGFVAILGVELSAYEWLQGAAPDDASEKFIEWLAECILANDLVRVQIGNDEYYFDGKEIQDYLNKKGM